MFGGVSTGSIAVVSDRNSPPRNTWRVVNFSILYFEGIHEDSIRGDHDMIKVKTVTVLGTNTCDAMA